MYKFCKICGEMKQFSHKLHMIIEKKVQKEDRARLERFTL